MDERILILGAGVTGAAIAYRLARAGADVTVIDRGPPASAASGRSFGWINASFSLDAQHFRLRVAAMAAHHRLIADLGTRATTWPGTISWDETGSAMEATHRRLSEAGYAVHLLAREAIRAALPALATPPETALHFPDEGVTDLARLTRDLLSGAMRHGARLVLGLPATAVMTKGDRVSGLMTEEGAVAAGRVILASGTGTPELLAPLGLSLPMLRPPAVLLRSQPLPPLLRHVIVTPPRELRQEPDGRLLAPASPNHQADDSTDLTSPPEALADAAARILAKLFPAAAPVWQEAVRAFRPVPGDGLPVVGESAVAGLYLAVMHSGATLAPLIGELAAQEIAGGREDALLAAYRPGRFA